MKSVIARYREFEPCGALRQYVSAFFTFAAPDEENQGHRGVARQKLFQDGEPLCSPLFADGHVSIVFSFGPAYRVDGLWSPKPAGPNGHVIGGMSVARPASYGERVVQVGAVVRAAQARALTGVPACELTDRIVGLAELWGAASSELETRLLEAQSDSERVDLLETVLVNRIAHTQNPKAALDLPGLARWAVLRGGRLTVEQLASAGGVSRQYLTRVFREEVGVAPKLYCRLARFQAALSYANSRATTDWADAAVHLGYFDQSHLIAEFRQFAGAPPARIGIERHFPPSEHSAEA
jgi:AraC-like DNA-binding protein